MLWYIHRLRSCRLKKGSWSPHWCITSSSQHVFFFFNTRQHLHKITDICIIRWNPVGHPVCNFLQRGWRKPPTWAIMTETNSQRTSNCKTGNYPRTPCKFNPVWIRLMSTLAVSISWFTLGHDFISCLFISCLLRVLGCLLAIKMIIRVSLANFDK